MDRLSLKIFLISILLLLQNMVAYAEIKTIEADGYYVVGDGPEERQYIAKERAKNQAIVRASEKAGTLVESISETHNKMLTRDDVKVVSASVMAIQSESYSMAIIENDAIQYNCHIIAIVDTGKVEGYFAQKAKDFDELLQKKVELENRNAQLTKEVIYLKAQYKQAKSEAEKNALARQVSTNENKYEAIYLTEKALDYRNANDWGTAEKLYKQAIEKDSKCYQAYVGLGQIYEYQGYLASQKGQDGTGKYSDAFNCMIEAFTALPEEETPYRYYSLNGMARTLRWLGKNEAAKSYYEIIVDMPNYHGYSSMAAWSLAVICRNEGNYIQAAEWCRKTLRIPSDGSKQDTHSKQEARKLLESI